MTLSSEESRAGAEALRRTLPYVWLIGSAVFLGAVLAGGTPEGTFVPYLVIDGVGWAMGLTLMLERGRLPQWFDEFAQYVGIAVVTALVAFGEDPDTPFALFYLWIAVQATYFVGWQRALLQGVTVAVAYAAALYAVSDGAAFPTVRWVMLATTVFVIGWLAADVRMRVAELMAKLDSVADTDALTGLGNRRRLLGDLERALKETVAGRMWTLVLFDLNGFKGYNDAYGHPAGDALLRALGTSLRDAVGPVGRSYRLGGDEFCVLAPVGPRDAVPLIAAGGAALCEEGRGFEISASSGTVLLPREASSVSEALRTADRRMYAAKGQRSGSPERQARDLLLRVLDAREPALRDHHDGVRRTASIIAERLGMEPEERDVLIRAAELHDIGKVGIPEDVLDKPGKLNEVEMEMVRTHTLIGQRILAATPAMAPVGRLVRSSHERWDGSGYPDGLAGEEIPLGARIILICDAFDAMTSERSYDQVRSVQGALDELRSHAGTQFDPRLVGLFCDLVRSGEITARDADTERAPTKPRT